MFTHFSRCSAHASECPCVLGKVVDHDKEMKESSGETWERSHIVNPDDLKRFRDHHRLVGLDSLEGLGCSAHISGNLGYRGGHLSPCQATRPSPEAFCVLGPPRNAQSAAQCLGAQDEIRADRGHCGRRLCRYASLKESDSTSFSGRTFDAVFSPRKTIRDRA